MKRKIALIAAATVLTAMMSACESTPQSTPTVGYSQFHTGVDMELTDGYAVKRADELSEAELQTVADEIKKNLDMDITLNKTEDLLTRQGTVVYGQWRIVGYLSVAPSDLYGTTEALVGRYRDSSYFRIIQVGYEINNSTFKSTMMTFHYAIMERNCYYLKNAVKVTTDNNGNRIWFDENGEVLRNDEDYTAWETIEESTSEEPQECYEFELERVVPVGYEIVENDYGNPIIIVRYARQGRQLKVAG